MSKRLISDDKHTGIKTFLNYDGTDDDAVISKEQDVTEIAEANKQAYNDAPKKFGDVAHVARIPMTVYYELQRKGILNDQEALAKWLNDPDNMVWRTRPGKI
jgi:hypothetical protein